MNTRQHPISIHLQRLASALLPGGFWRADRFQVVAAPAGQVAIHATKAQAMLNREVNRDRGYRKA